jgi:hypothetical protein
MFLLDIQEIHSELLQLTAGDTNHHAINGWQTVIAVKPWETCKTLKNNKKLS